ncbi:MAG: superoxide dismutase [Lachnospiraceae bacterium]|jgi:Fe-Mn family superoxide dismutase|nr:superoxide dismutase [Lachnospiraceae bacterium]MBR1849387.1 superoxide dismutase [Lachnospiraceae bacterium]
MFTQYQLPYGYDALEPHIDTLTMETHHGKHHATYTKNFNDAVEKAGLGDKTVEEILANLNQVSDEALRKALRNNGGGFYNHNLYFSTLSPNGGKAPTGALAAQIEKDFGSFDALVEKLSTAAATQFGSGWAFLSKKPDGSLVVSQSLNQDNPISEGTGNKPIMCIDVWEHAYYLKFKNLRPDYIKTLFNVIDWELVAKNYEG